MPDQTETDGEVEEVEALETIFEQTALAVVAAQRKLDGELGADHVSRREAEGQAMLYSIPRVDVDVEFGLNIDAQRKMLLILPRGRRRQKHAHHLRFSLVAVSEPPPPLNPAPAALTSASATSDAAVASSNPNAPVLAAAPPFYLREPNFMLSPKDEREVYARLVGALARAGEWKSMLPDSAKPLTQSDVNRELVELHKAFDKDTKDFELRAALAKAKDADRNRERGLVYFRLDTAPLSYLVARVTGKSKNDSLFVLTPAPAPGEPQVEIYSVEGDSTPHLQYRPLHLLGLAIRRWLEGQPPLLVRLDHGAPPNLGLEDLQRFALNMREGYVRALGVLSKLTDDDALYPALYDLTNVVAELSYSVNYEDPGTGEELGDPRFNFLSGDGQDYMLIQSRAQINATRRAGAAHVEIELSAPEFALSGEARTRFLGYFVNPDNAKDFKLIVDDIRIRAHKNGESPDDYEGFIRNRAFWPSVVVLLSYKGQTPKEQFLVIWPGTSRTGELRSFVFTCSRIKNQDELELTKWILGVEDRLENVQLETAAQPAPSADTLATLAPSFATLAAPVAGASDAESAVVAPQQNLFGSSSDKDLSEEQYQAFHNFFHAVRVWRARVSPRK